MIEARRLVAGPFVTDHPDQFAQRIYLAWDTGHKEVPIILTEAPVALIGASWL